MNALAQRLPFHYGWFLLGAAIAGNAIAGGSIFWVVTVYVPLLSDEFDVGRSFIVGAFMGGQTAYALVQPFIGRYIDQHGARDVMRVGAVACAASLVLASRTQNEWQFVAAWLLVSVIRPSVMPIPFNWTLTRWFEGRRRQAALGLVTVGFGLGGAVVLPIYAAIADATDWRTVMALSGVLLLLIQGFAAFVVTRDRPAELGLQPIVARSEDRAGITAEADEWGFTSGEALRTPAFWLMSLGLMLFFTGQGSVTTLAVDFFDTRAVTWGATAIAASALIRAIGRIPLGLAMGSISAVYLLGVGVALSQGVAVGALLIEASTVGVITWVILWGVGGAFAPMLEPLMITNAFGVRHFGAVSGITQMVSFGGQLFGSIGGAALYDLTGSYDVPYALYALGFVASAVLFWLFGIVVKGPHHHARAARPRGGAIEPAR
ncbi:MAG: MFS transporter [Dehalococcoidia bacterium]